jgi:CYTH domain-containing protein
VSDNAELEIERKYLLRGAPQMPAPLEVYEIEQGYLPGVRLVERLRRQQSRAGDVRYFRTVKVSSGFQRIELEEETDERTFAHLWQLTKGRQIRKRRYVVADGDAHWEIDEFLDRPLWLAELEIPTVETRIDIPDWLAQVLVRDVTEEREYTNRNLAR